MSLTRLGSGSVSHGPDWAGLPRELLHHVYGQLEAAYSAESGCCNDQILRER